MELVGMSSRSRKWVKYYWEKKEKMERKNSPLSVTIKILTLENWLLWKTEIWGSIWPKIIFTSFLSWIPFFGSLYLHWATNVT